MFDQIDSGKKFIIFLIITNILSIGLCLYFYYHKDNEIEEAPNTIYVQIAGEVNHPDVYQVKYGTILDDLIVIAGGFTENADIEFMNLAITLSDGMKITVPPLNTDPNGNPQTSKININTADLETLKKLNGIGDAKAEAIIDYREKNGPFLVIEDIMKVKGIGEATFENIKDDICC